jgi:hypothetical protein
VNNDPKNNKEVVVSNISLLLNQRVTCVVAGTPECPPEQHGKTVYPATVLHLWVSRKTVSYADLAEMTLPDLQITLGFS